MKVKKLYKTLSIIVFMLASVLILLLSGCMDLGNFEEGEDGNYDDYYNAFSNVTLVNKEKDSTDYSIKNSFFNNTTVNELTWESSVYEVEADEYMFMYLSIEREKIMLDDFALYIKGVDGSNTVRLDIDMYVVDKISAFNKLKPYDYEPEEGEEEEGDPSDPDNNVALLPIIASTSCVVTPNKWNSLAFGSFMTDGKQYGTKEVLEDQYIVLKFVNNTKEGSTKELSNVKFTLINLLIRDKS